MDGPYLGICESTIIQNLEHQIEDVFVSLEGGEEHRRRSTHPVCTDWGQGIDLRSIQKQNPENPDAPQSVTTKPHICRSTSVKKAPHSTRYFGRCDMAHVVGDLVHPSQESFGFSKNAPMPQCACCQWVIKL